MKRPRIVIVGAGFAGLQAARCLRHARAEVVLADAQPSHAFVPLFYQVATGLLPPDCVQQPLRQLARRQANLRVRQARVTALNLAAQQLQLNDGTLRYDYLILATGSQPRSQPLPGAATGALPFASLDDAIALRDRLLACWRRAALEPDPESRQRLLTVVLIGGGPTGVELAGSIQEWWRGTAQRRYPSLRAASLRLVLVQSDERLLALWPEALSHYTARHLQRLGIEVRLGVRARAVTDAGVELATGEAIAAATVVWTGGLVAQHPPAEPALPTAARREQLLVEPTLQLPGYPNVYAAGDLAYREQHQRPLPSVAPVAIQAGAAAARNIQRQLRGRSPQPFTYQDKGRAAIVARYAGIVETEQVHLQGWLGWLLWLVIHWCYLPGWSNRARALWAWSGDWLGRPRSWQPCQTPAERAARSPQSASRSTPLF